MCQGCAIAQPQSKQITTGAVPDHQRLPSRFYFASFSHADTLLLGNKYISKASNAFKVDGWIRWGGTSQMKGMPQSTRHRQRNFRNDPPHVRRCMKNVIQFRFFITLRFWLCQVEAEIETPKALLEMSKLGEGGKRIQFSAMEIAKRFGIEKLKVPPRFIY